MKKLMLFATLLVTVHAAVAQVNRKDYTFSKYSQNEGDTTPSLITATRQNDYAPSSLYDNKHITQLLNTLSFSHRPHHFSYSTTYDSSEACFFAAHIDRNNASQYEFRILKNDRIIVLPWTNITHFARGDQAPKNDGKEIALLGSYKTGFGNYLVVDLRKKKTDSILAYTLVIWSATQPHLRNIYTSHELNEFLNRLASGRTHRDLESEEIKKWQQRYPPEELDTANSLPKKLVLPSIENVLIFSLKTEFNQCPLEYRIIKDGAPFMEWQKNDFHNLFIWLNDLSPGEYRLDMRYPIQPQNQISYPFQIKPAWHQTAAFKLVAGSLIAAFFGFIILLFRTNRQKQKLLAEQQKKDKMETEIRAIRAQLNPHFVFNSLNSIQGLINKSEIDKANNYLAEFANLMRDVLNGNNNENNELYREIQTLESYLNLEQLRFHFLYRIDTGRIGNLSEIQVPSLLLQPLVENAVKHGISALQEKGRIEIMFSQRDNDLLVRITDNGKGFQVQQPAEGYGLKLTRKRIALINEISKIHSIVMDLDTGAGTGTSINLTFKNWLA